jgi:hypothetical protein
MMKSVLPTRESRKKGGEDNPRHVHHQKPGLLALSKGTIYNILGGR